MKVRIIIFLIIIIGTGVHAYSKITGNREKLPVKRKLVEITGLIDLSVVNDARYLRHLSITEPSIPFQDYPCSFDYLPSTLFFAPPEIKGR
jgi:hypothetical protein